MKRLLLLTIAFAVAACVSDEGARAFLPDRVGIGASHTSYDYLGAAWHPDRLTNEDGDANTIGIWASWDIKGPGRHNDLMDRVDSLQAALVRQSQQQLKVEPIKMEWPATPPGWARAPEAPAQLPAAPPAWLSAAVDRVVAALDRFGAALASIPREIKLDATQPVVIQPPAVTVNVQDPRRQQTPELTRDVPAPGLGTTIKIENKVEQGQQQEGELGQTQGQTQEQEQEQEQIEDRVIGATRDLGEIIASWGWGTWLMIVGLLAVVCTGGFFLLRAWRRRNAEPEDCEKPSED